MTRRRRRTLVLALCLLALGGATALVLSAFDDSLVFFFSPTDVQAKGVGPNQRIRVGGLVVAGSVGTGDDGVTARFVITDTATELPVAYRGVLPDLFREGQGIVAQGRLGPDGVFVADEVLAKHDETYMPPEVADAIKRTGEWRGGTAVR